ncbi:MAG: phage tail protein [Alphaproteobacteria bacterium]|jgi:phage-related protein|nr:phage tail protein [Alphaproteobacteria bacterium]
MPTFTYAPDYGATARREPRTKSVRFGDGYEQRQSDGINTNPEIWDLNFTNWSETDGNAIDDFLAARGSIESFDWTPPGGSAGKFVCRNWSKSYVIGNLISISATFEQVFEA